jgi:hypothetical protein
MSGYNGFSYSVMSAGAAALVLALGCSGGDLTLPRSNQPAALTIVSGDGQRADAGALLDEPLTVQVLDGGSGPVAGIPVQFSFLGVLPGAALDPASILTDEDGRAAAIVRLGEVPGEQIIVARVTAAQTPDLSARFSATAILSEDKHGGGSDGKGGQD